MQQGAVSQTSNSESGSGFHVVHAVRGRTRIRVDSPELLARLAETIEGFFAEHPGLREVRVNPDCLSVVVTYDPDVVHVEVPVSTDDPTAGWTASALDALTWPRDVAEDLTTTTVSTVRDLVQGAIERWNERAPAWLSLAGPAINGRSFPSDVTTAARQATSRAISTLWMASSAVARRIVVPRSST